MNRREFIAVGAAGSALWTDSPQPDREQQLLERSTPSASPAIVLNHLGFRPEGRKVLVVRADKPLADARFTMQEVGSVLEPFSITRPLTWVSSGDLKCHLGDFSDVTRMGMYQITVGEERSVPFFIRPDVWRRTLPKAVGYHKYQRCGVEVPNVHPICHLDDARRLDNGVHMDLGGGGWHDAGDLRKWMGATMLNAIGLLWLSRNLGSGWDLAGSDLVPLHEEVRWGNRYFLKMQDQDGLVFADVAGGVNGDNSDNHWTDNRVGTPDDRYLNVSKPDDVQAMFVVLQGMMAETFFKIDVLTRILVSMLLCAAGALSPLVPHQCCLLHGGSSLLSNSGVRAAVKNIALRRRSSVQSCWIFRTPPLAAISERFAGSGIPRERIARPSATLCFQPCRGLRWSSSCADCLTRRMRRVGVTHCNCILMSMFFP
jgi:Glycosyl hydrolase family 9/Cellulase N-terminal ig-like domain